MRAVRHEPLLVAVLVGALACLGGAAVRSQGDDYTDGREDAEFHFARMIYQDLRGGGGWFRGRGRGWWMQDYPDAEVHFRQGISRLTRIDAGVGVVVELSEDSELFDYPWLYATQAGYWDLSDSEIDVLREYLLRGGFLVTDDFWDQDEWGVFAEAMTRLFPDWPIVEITGGDDEVLHVLYDVDQLTQIPGARHLGGYRDASGRFAGLPEPRWRGINDEEGRLLVAANFNQDVGDAWEHADDAFYPQPMTALAYRFGINYIIYAMTH